jgi:hypothetical protein
MKVYVVMSNDYPANVWATEELAKAYCKASREENVINLKQGVGRVIYYRVYSFDVLGEDTYHLTELLSK